MRPLLHLDVDGDLMPTGRSIPPGFERYPTLDAEIVVARQHGERQHDLLVLLEVVWATTWRESADRIIGGFNGQVDIVNKIGGSSVARVQAAEPAGLVAVASGTVLVTQPQARLVPDHRQERPTSLAVPHRQHPSPG